MSIEFMDHDSILHCPSNTGNVGDFSDPVIDNWARYDIKARTIKDVSKSQILPLRCRRGRNIVP